MPITKLFRWLWNCWHDHPSHIVTLVLLCVQSIPGVAPCPERLNPATWMLDVSTIAAETKMGADFADIYDKSELAKWVYPPCVPLCVCPCLCVWYL